MNTCILDFKNFIKVPDFTQKKSKVKFNKKFPISSPFPTDLSSPDTMLLSHIRCAGNMTSSKLRLLQYDVINPKIFSSRTGGVSR